MSEKEKGPKKRNLRNLRKSIRMLAIIFVLVLIVVPVSTVFNYKEGKSRSGKGVTSKAADTFDEKTFSGLLVEAYINAYDDKAFQTKIKFTMSPYGSLRSVDRGFIVASRNFTVDFVGTKTVKFNASQPVSDQELSVSWLESDLNAYPADKIFTVIYVNAYITDGNTKIPVPVAMYLWSAAQGFRADITFVDGIDLGQLEYNIITSRSATTIFFSVFVMIALWCIAFASLAVSASFYFLRFYDAVPLTLNATLLFAVPNVRNLQPGIPTIGCTADLASFFWVEGILALNQVLVMYIFFKRKYMLYQQGITEDEENANKQIQPLLNA
ncbi:hypothetical protein EDD86DRAFT_117516 [Gorgonomyces haynaldii]|nr:hypothetical protein EDD86DRAFT_117516 [Gorgonomyces haynaldii]